MMTFIKKKKRRRVKIIQFRKVNMDNAGNQETRCFRESLRREGSERTGSIRKAEMILIVIDYPIAQER